MTESTSKGVFIITPYHIVGKNIYYYCGERVCAGEMIGLTMPLRRTIDFHRIIQKKLLKSMLGKNVINQPTYERVNQKQKKGAEAI